MTMFKPSLIGCLHFIGSCVAIGDYAFNATSSTSAPGCTQYISVTSTNTARPVAAITRTATEVITFILHITPFPNGTSATSHEMLNDPATSPPPPPPPQMIIITPTPEAPRYRNTTTAITASPETSTRSCPTTITYIVTHVSTVVPGTSFVYTATITTVSTLFNYDYLTPPVYETEPKATSTSNLIENLPGHTPKPSEPSPGTTKNGQPQPGPSSGAPQDSPKGPPKATANNPITKKPADPIQTGFPENQMPGVIVNPPVITLPQVGPITIDPSRSVIIVSGTSSEIRPGQQTTVNNVPISFDTSAGFVVVDKTKTFALPQITAPPNPNPVVIGGTTIDIGQVATQIRPGQVTTLGSHTVSHDDSGSFIIIDSTQSIPLVQGSPALSTSTLVIDGTTIRIGQLATQLAPSSTTVIGSMTVSRDVSALYVGTSTIPLSPAVATPRVVVLGGTTISAGALPSGFEFAPSAGGGGLRLPNGETLMPGGETTIAGMELSLMEGETPIAVINDSISVTATNSDGKETSGRGCSESGRCGQPSSTATGQGEKPTGGAVVNTVVGWWWDIVFATVFAEIFANWI